MECKRGDIVEHFKKKKNKEEEMLNYLHLLLLHGSSWCGTICSVFPVWKPVLLNKGQIGGWKCVFLLYSLYVCLSAADYSVQ